MQDNEPGHESPSEPEDPGSDRRDFWRGVLWGGAPVLLLFLVALLLGVRGFQPVYDGGFAQKLGAMFFWAAIGWSVMGSIAVIALYGRFMGAMATGILASLSVAWVVVAVFLVVM